MAQTARRITEEPQLIAEEIDIITEVENDPVIALTNQAKFEAYVAAIEKQARAVPVDLTTTTGRDKIKSEAAKIARKKVAIDSAGKDKTEEWRKLTAAVNAARNVVKERMDALRDDIRRPVTEWEQKEEERIREAGLIMQNLREAAIVRVDETSADVQARLDRVRGHNLNSELFGPRIEMVTDLRDETVATLSAAIERLLKAEADAAELARLRRAEEERKEQEERERQAAAEREAEKLRVEQEKHRLAEVERIARQNAEDAAQRAHQAELDRIEREKQAEIDEAIERARKAEADAAAERQRIAEEKAAAEAEAKRIADEKAKREADKAHRLACMTEAKLAIMSCGIGEEEARKVVMLSIAGELPHMPFQF